MCIFRVRISSVITNAQVTGILKHIFLLSSVIKHSKSFDAKTTIDLREVINKRKANERKGKTSTPS